MNRHQVLTGAANSGDQCFASGSVEGVNFTAYAAGCDIVILASDFQRVQIIAGVLHDNLQVTCIDCCTDVGKLAVAYGSRVCIFEPTPLLHHDSTHKLDYKWYHTGTIETGCDIFTLSWNLEGSRLLTGGQLIQMWHCPEIDSTVEFFIHDDRMTSSTEAELPQWTQLWHCKPATPVQQVTFSPDGLLFGTVGKNDRLLKIWYENRKVQLPMSRADSISPKKEDLNFSFVYIAHPRAVRGFSWRKTSKYMPRASVANMLITSCKDNISRLWCETILPEDGLVDVLQLNPDATQNPMFNTRRHKRRFMQRLHHFRHVVHQRKGNAHHRPIVPLPSSKSVHDFHKFGVHSNSTAPGFHFHLAGCINPDTDIPMVQAMSRCSDSKKLSFVAHWLNNKELQFSHGAEKILEEMSRKSSAMENLESGGSGTDVQSDSDEITSDSAADAVKGKGGESGNGKKPEGIFKRSAQNVSMDSERSAMSTSSSSFGMPESKTADMLDKQIEGLLRDWHHNPDMLFSIHPVDGSFLVWVVDWLDEYNPGSFRQAQISMSSRIPHSIPLGDAKTMSSHMLLYSDFGRLNVKSAMKQSEDKPAGENHASAAPPSSSDVIYTPNVNLVSKHNNGSLNLWQINFSEMSQFSTVQCVVHVSRACGHRFQTNHVSCHPVLPLLLTTSHHNVPHADTDLPRPRYPGGKRDPGPGGFCSELILWNVEAVGPLSKSGGVTELARINSPEMSAFSNVAWLPTLLPGSGTLSNSPSALFVASDGATLRVYQAVIDARKLLSGVQLKPPPMEVSQSDSVGSLVSDSDVELPVKTTLASDVSIVSLQSTACPGAILQLDRVLDAEHDWQHIQMIHVFQDQLITGQESLQCGFKSHAKMEPIVDLQKMKTFEEHFYLVVIEKLSKGTSILHMWRIVISSHSEANHVGFYSPDVNFFQEDESGEKIQPIMSEPTVSQQTNTGRRLAITTSKVCTQTLGLPDGVQIVCATMAAGHLSSSSIYPACFAPYLISTASTDGCTRFWKCHTTSEMSDIPGVVTRHFEWAEWDMMIRKDDVSEIHVPGRPITVSCAYSGRVAIAYRMGHVRVHGHGPDNKFINLYVAIYECESTGGSEWTLEDTIELKNICITNVKADLDLAAIFGSDHHGNHDEHLVSSTKSTPAVTRTSVPSATTIQCVRRSLSTQQSLDNAQILRQEQLVHLDWVTTEDGSHILTVGVGPNIMLYAAVSSEIASASVKEMPAPTRGILQKSKSMTVQQVMEEIRWMKIRSVELSTADGLPPLPMHISWVRDGLLVVGMDNEMHVYSQWQAQKVTRDAVAAEKSDTSDVRTLTQQKMHRVTSLTNVNPVRSLKIARSMSNMALTAGLVSVASISNLNMLMEMKEEKGKKRESSILRHKPDAHKVDTSDTSMQLTQDNGLFEAARLANPVLPQYHPKQLIELLNFGRIQRVKAILAHLLRCISGTAEMSMSYDSHKGRQRLFSAPTLTAPPGSPDMLQDEVQLDYSEISSIPPLPLYALIAADDDIPTAYTPMEHTRGPKAAKKDDDHYEALFEIGGPDDELDDTFASDDDTSVRSNRGSDDGSPPAHPNYFGPQQAQTLARHLTYTHLPGLSRLDQMYLLAVADTVANAKLDITKKHATDNLDGGREDDQVEATDIVDDCGLRFQLAARHYIYMQNTMPLRQRAQLLQQGLSPANIVWAFHSEAEQDLLNVIPSYQRGAPLWSEMKQFGVGWWIKNIITLRRLIEKLAKAAFQAKKDPLDAAVFYLAMKKKNVLWGLFRSVNEDRMMKFFKNDFSQERWRKAALKNAFSLLGKQRFEHAAAFFLLGGAVDDAIEVCINKLDDMQLAIVIARLYGNDLNEVVPAKLKHLLHEKCLGCDSSGQNPDITNAHPDPFIRSIACWLLKDYSGALGTLLEMKAGSARVDDEGDKDAYLAKPSVFNFYNYLRTHPLLIRQNLAASASGKAVLLAGFSQKQHGGDDIVTFVDKISPVERSLYFMTAHAHFKSGCPALALEVLSKLPAVVDTSNDITMSHSGDVSATAGISSGTIDDFVAGKSGDNADSFDWGAPKAVETTDSFDWSQPVLAPVEDELVLTFDDDDDDKDDTDEEEDHDEAQKAVDDVSEDGNKTLTESVCESKKLEVGDIMAHQLKFIACLKIMMEELATLATGFEVDGGQLRYQLYVWLEKEVDVLKKLCNYGQDMDTASVPGMNDGGSSGSAEDTSSLFSHSHTLHEVILAEKMDFEAKLRRMAKRKHWLETNQQLLRTLLSYSVLHGSCGGGLASVRMELILLLQELQQEKTTQQLLSPLPFPTTLPLLSSSISRAVIVNPIRHLENMTNDMLYTIVNFREPPTLTYMLPKVMTLRNMSAALSACIYQCLCDSDDFVISRNEHYDVGMEGFTSTKVVYTDSYLMAGVHGRRRLSSASSGGDDVPNSTPGMWPGVSSLQALLARERDENQPELNMLLTEATVAVYTSLLIHSLTTYDPNLLYRLVANPFVERMWPALFGGGVKKLVRLSRATDAKTKVAQSNDDTAKQRMKLHMKLLEAGGSSVPLQENRLTFKEKFVPPEVSMLSYFMAKPFVMPDLHGVVYDSGESVCSSDEEEEEDELIGAPSTRNSKQEHLDPNSYSWYLMRYAIVKFIHYRLLTFLPHIGIELSDLPVRSPLLQAVLTTLDQWRLLLKGRLEMFAGPPEDYIPGLFVDNLSTGPAMLKYKALLEPNNTPFLSTHYSALPAKRLWHYLVQQQPIQEVFIRYIFKKRQPQNDNYKKESQKTSPDDPIKIVHKEQEVIAAFCLNQANTNCMALSTQKELIEMDVSGIITPPMWLQDETEYDIETIKRPSKRLQDTSDFLVVQTAADKHVMSNGFSHSPSGSMTSVYSGRLDHDRGGSMMVKRQVAGVRRMGAHPALPYYLTGSQDGSVRLWEWGQQHCIAVARQPGSFPKVAKVAFSAQGNKFGVGDSEGSVCLWQVGLGCSMTKPFLRLQCHNKSLSDFVFMGSSSVLATAGHSLENRNVCIWDTLLPHRSALVQAFSCHHDGSAAVVYAPQHQALITAGKKGDICIFDVRQRQLRHSFQAHDVAIRSMTLQPSEGIFATGSVDGDIKVWGLAVHNLMFSFAGKHSKGSIFRNNGSGPVQLYLGGQGHLFSCGADGSMKIRHLPDKLLLQQLVC